MFKTGINEYKRYKTSVAIHLDRYTIIKEERVEGLGGFEPPTCGLGKHSAV